MIAEECAAISADKDIAYAFAFTAQVFLPYI